MDGSTDSKGIANISISRIYAETQNNVRLFLLLLGNKTNVIAEDLLRSESVDLFEHWQGTDIDCVKRVYGGRESTQMQL
jgi:hypothetical protein